MDSISQMTCSALNNVNTRPTVVFIDAVNQVSAAQPLYKGHVCSVQNNVSSKTTSIPYSTISLQGPCLLCVVQPLYKGHVRSVLVYLSSGTMLVLCSPTSTRAMSVLCSTTVFRRPGGGGTTPGGLLIGKIFVENCMKMKQVAFQSNANHPLAESMDYIKFEGM